MIYVYVWEKEEWYVILRDTSNSYFVFRTFCFIEVSSQPPPRNKHNFSLNTVCRMREGDWASIINDVTRACNKNQWDLIVSVFPRHRPVLSLLAPSCKLWETFRKNLLSFPRLLRPIRDAHQERLFIEIHIGLVIKYVYSYMMIMNYIIT